MTDSLLFDLDPPPPKPKRQAKKTAHEVNPEAEAERQLYARLRALVEFYSKTVRFASSTERAGVVRNMKLAIGRGLTIEQLEQAAKHYAYDPWVSANDPRLRKSIRSFFVYENLVQWLAPISTKAINPNRDASLNALDRLNDE